MKIEILYIAGCPHHLEAVEIVREIIAGEGNQSVVDEVEVDEDARKRKEGVANAAGGLVSSLIPFRSLVREISGAGRADRDYREALYAGVVRRGYLKGLGEARNCPAPARPLHPLEGAAQAAGQAIRGKDDE